MRKAVLKRTGDTLEKLAVGSALVALFQGQVFGFIIATICLTASYVCSIWEVKK